MALPVSHFFFSRENLTLLVSELNDAIRVWTQSRHHALIRNDDPRLPQDVLAHAEQYANIVLGVRDEHEGSQMLRQLFVRDRLQQYAVSPEGSFITSAGMRVDQSLGRSKRQSAVTGPLTEINSKQEMISIAFARGSRAPGYMQEQWKLDRQNVASLYHVYEPTL